MAIAAWILGSLGGLSAAMGIITAAEIMDPLMVGFTPMFWLALSGVLLLASIAFALSRGSYE
jgi:predicted outer membrane lipoprotein